jgi:hypothetical protein
MEPNGNKSVATVLPRVGGFGPCWPFNQTSLLSLLAQGGGYVEGLVQVSGSGVADCSSCVAEAVRN